jgi:hypothetical protein
VSASLLPIAFVVTTLASPGVLQRATAPAAPSLDAPCSFVSASDMSSLVGAHVSAAVDEHFRCKYTIGTGWLETKLMDFSLKMSRDIYDYNKAHGKSVPGVGDQAYVLGAALAVKVGDVLVVVDASNTPRPMPDNAKLKAVATKIVRAIP